jgi:Aspartyl protease
MPHIHAEVTNLLESGPSLPVRVGISRALEFELRRKGETAPAAVKVTMQIDTGSQVSVVTPPIIKALGLSPIARSQMITPGSDQPVSVPVFDLALYFAKGIIFPVKAVQASLKGQNIQGLIGRDVLRIAVLLYQGELDQFTLSF